MLIINMLNTSEKILLAHGSGGKLSADLIKDVFVKAFDNPVLQKQGDSAILDLPAHRIAFTTDSYVIDPIFFHGGNIGKLAICGTVNDLAVAGAKPMYISASFIIEEGLLISDLKKIVNSMAEEAKVAGVKIVTGDTKVVDRGKCDKVFINTAGVGVFNEDANDLSTGDSIVKGDKVIVNGTLADHGMAILSLRNELDMDNSISSDCACLSPVIGKLVNSGLDIKFMRDATRGGVATVLNELASSASIGIQLNEDKIPVKSVVMGICELLGMDPLYVANEGKFVMIVAEKDTAEALRILGSDPLGKDCALIGEVVESAPGKVYMKTLIGGKRIVDMLTGSQLPRIC